MCYTKSPARGLLISSFCLSILLGCGMRPTTYMHPSLDISYVEKVAVMPFENHTREQYAQEKMKEVFIIELLAAGAFDVVEPGEVSKAMAESGVRLDSSSLNVEDIKKVGQALQVQALFFGAVEEYREIRVGNTTSPEVSVSLRMVDVESGSIVWSVSHTRGGAGWKTRLFGVSGGTLSEFSRKVLREAVGTLFQ